MTDMQDKYGLCSELWGTSLWSLEREIRVVTFEETEVERDCAAGRDRGEDFRQREGQRPEDRKDGAGGLRSPHLAGVLDAFQG